LPRNTLYPYIYSLGTQRKGITRVVKKRTSNLLVLFTAAWLLPSLSGCGQSMPAFQTPTESSLPQPPAKNAPIPDDNEDGTEMAPPLVIVPVGIAPTIDGTLSPGEWDGATVETFADGSQLFLLQTGEFMYVGIRAHETGLIAGNVFINRGDQIEILHTSAALGTAIYQQGVDGWQQIQNFTWRCRNTGDSESARTERTEFLQDEGWLAANGLMGTPNELEYQIKIPDQDFRLAIVYIKATFPYDKVPWPANLNDDCAQPSSGELPAVMQFSPAQWVRLGQSK
jgi:hypothetical protein